jgi:PST family polysaccharide transporter
MTDESAVFSSAAAPPALPVEEALPGPKQSYRDILKSSAIIGGSSAINVCIGIVRTKVLAVLLGPAGYGMMGAYVLIVELTRSIAQMGLNASGVRQIADAVATGDSGSIARTVTVLRRISLACAVLGAVLLAVFSRQVANLTFGSEQHAGAIAWLSLAVFFAIVAGGQGALLQGMRRIGDMAKLAVLGGLLGTITGIPLVYFMGEAGLVPTLVIVAASAVLTSWWYSRKVKIVAPTLSLRETAGESAALLKLGFAFMASGLLTIGAAYAVRIIVLRMAGLDAAGVYYAAWTLGGLYIGFVLQALGTDFYPRLVGVVKDNDACNRLVNEQAQVSLLLAIPGVLLTLTLAPLAIALFYSARFAPAVGVLRWICLGMALRVLTWPIGYIVVAKNRQMLFFAVELAWTVVNVGLTWWCVQQVGVNGAGIAFFGSYLFHGLLVYPIVRRQTGFRWSAANRRTASAGFALVGAVFIGFHVLPPVAAMTFGLLATLIGSYVSVRVLVHLVSPDRLPRSIGRFLQLRSLTR